MKTPAAIAAGVFHLAHAACKYLPSRLEQVLACTLRASTCSQRGGANLEQIPVGVEQKWVLLSVTRHSRHSGCHGAFQLGFALKLRSIEAIVTSPVIPSDATISQKKGTLSETALERRTTKGRLHNAGGLLLCARSAPQVLARSEAAD
jgi:hypothetical protein